MFTGVTTINWNLIVTGSFTLLNNLTKKAPDALKRIFIHKVKTPVGDPLDGSCHSQTLGWLHCRGTSRWHRGQIVAAFFQSVSQRFFCFLLGSPWVTVTFVRLYIYIYIYIYRFVLTHRYPHIYRIHRKKKKVWSIQVLYTYKGFAAEKVYKNNKLCIRFYTMLAHVSCTSGMGIQ